MKGMINELKQNKIGVLVLGAGAAFLFLVLYFAYQTFFTVSDGRDGPALSRAEIVGFKQAGLPVEQKEQATQQPSLQSRKTITERQLIGDWDSRIDEGRALLQLREGTYRLVIIMDNKAAARWYSNGYYELSEGGLLVLKPNLDWGAPTGQAQYRILTRADMPVIASLYKGRLVWQKPDSNIDIYVPNTHPFLDLIQSKIAFWRVLK